MFAYPSVCPPYSLICRTVNPSQAEVWSDSTLYPGPTPMPAPGRPEVSGESVNGWSACVFASKLLGWRPKALEPGHKPDSCGGGCFIRFEILPPTASLHILSPSGCPALLHPRAYLQISALPKACFRGQVGPSIWSALTHRQSYVPSQQGQSKALGKGFDLFP